ncbi:rhodanese-like domain-containing protein, partial [Klebsiella variicola]|uniref:rhodanese-like domain-containing protein n=1 Tax=Klebsiella variicola TaxID=244366 RepID=UPI00272FB233
ASVLSGGIASGLALPVVQPVAYEPLALISPKAFDVNAVNLIDLRPSMAFRKGHIPGARWSIRSRLKADNRPLVLLAYDPALAAFAAHG